MRVEYGLASDGSMQYLKIWASTTRGYWNLICEQWMTTAWSHVPGLRFSTGYYSESLAHLLEIIARHHDVLMTVSGEHRNGSLQISPPTEEESREARRLTADVVAVLGASPVEQLVAAWKAVQTEETVAD